MPDDADRLVQWLLAGVTWKTTVFHVGQYCGRWHASTAGRSLASFHAVLRGRCWLHRPGRPAVALEEGEAVFLLRDLPHHISPDANPAAPALPTPLQPTWPARAGGTALACGFVGFEGPLTAWLLGALDEPLLLRRGQPEGDLHQAARVFDLMREEADRCTCPLGQPDEDTPSALLERLAGLLFHYVLRHAVRHDGAAAARAGLWCLARHPQLAPLLSRLLEQPSQDWTAQRMAESVHMSRARFFREFTSACGEPPAQFLQRLRMQLAAQRLHRGDSVARAAQFVGYQSDAAFTRAFRQVLGVLPGAWQRTSPAAAAPH